MATELLNIIRGVRFDGGSVVASRGGHAFEGVAVDNGIYLERDDIITHLEHRIEGLRQRHRALHDIQARTEGAGAPYRDPATVVELEAVVDELRSWLL